MLFLSSVFSAFFLGLEDLPREDIYRKNMYFDKNWCSRGSVLAWDSKVRGAILAKHNFFFFFLLSQILFDFRFENLEKVLPSIQMYCLLKFINVYLFYCRLVDFFESKSKLFKGKTEIEFILKKIMFRNVIKTSCIEPNKIQQSVNQ